MIGILTHAKVERPKFKGAGLARFAYRTDQPRPPITARGALILGWLLSTTCAASGQSNDPVQPRAPASAGTPYSMRGALLGITLDEFRDVPIPADKGQTNLRSRCTSDDPQHRYSIIEEDPGEIASGIITCNWFGTSKNSSVEWAMYISLGEGAGLPAFDFVDDGNEKRLFRIRIYANADYSPAIARGLTDRYGPPVTTIDKMQMGNGNMIDASTRVWSNAASSITFETPCRRIDRYCLTYRHKALYKFYDAIMAKRAAAAAEKF